MNRTHKTVWGCWTGFLLTCLIAWQSTICQAQPSGGSEKSGDELQKLQSAAAKGEARSQCLLGISYLLGKGAPQDYSKGAEWLQKAADQGVTQAQNALGLMYRDGKGVPQDYVKAAEYFQKAEDQGDDIARHNLEALRSEGKLGNFVGYKERLAKTGLFNASGSLNGFSVFESKESKLNSVAMRPCDGYCCEGLITAEPMDEDDLDTYISFLYSPLQNTLYLTHKESVANGFKERVSILRSQIMDNLKQATRTEFAFDHLNVRAECLRISDADLKSGKRPVLTIKLWIP